MCIVNDNHLDANISFAGRILLQKKKQQKKKAEEVSSTRNNYSNFMYCGKGFKWHLLHHAGTCSVANMQYLARLYILPFK